MVDVPGTRSQRSWLLAVVMAVASCSAVAQESAPSAPPDARWSGQLADVANLGEARFAVKVLRNRPPSQQLALLGEALKAREVLADAALRDRVLQVVATFPEHTSALVTAFLAAEPANAMPGPRAERRSAGAFAFVAAAWPRANAAQLKEMESWVQAEVRGARWSHPEERPWLQLWAQVAIAAVERDDTLQPLDRQRRLGEQVRARETGWALADALVRHASGPSVAAWLVNRLLRVEPAGVAGIQAEVVDQLAAWQLAPQFAEALAGRALLLAHCGEEPLACIGAALWLTDSDPSKVARAKQLLLRDPPHDDDERAFVVAVAGHAGPELQRAVLGWLRRGVLDARLLDRAAAWQRNEWLELAQAVGTGSSVRQQQRVAPPSATLLAIGPDTGIERLLEELARLEGRRKSVVGTAPPSRDALWGDVPWVDREGAIVVDMHDDAAFDVVLRALPPAPAGLVPRLCRIVMDRDGGELPLARACAKCVLLAKPEGPSNAWSDRDPVLRAFPVRSVGEGVPTVVVGPPATWRQLAELARAFAPLMGQEPYRLAPEFEQAADGVGVPQWPSAGYRCSPDGWPSGPDWGHLDRVGWLAFPQHPISDGVKDAFEGPSPLFGAVQLHRRDIDGLPAIESTMRPAEPAPR